MIKIFICKNCGFKSYSFEKILNIPLLLPNNNINKNFNNNITPNKNFYDIGNNNKYNIKYFINKRKNIKNLMELIEKYFEGEDFQ